MTRDRIKTKYPGIYYRGSDQGRRYIVWYSDANGDPHTKTLPVGAALEDARTLQSSLNVRKAQGETLVRTKKTVGELLDEWLELRRHSLAPKTVEDYSWAIEKHLKPEFGRMKVEDLRPGDVARLFAKLKRDGAKTWTVKKIVTPLTGAYRVAVREGGVSTSPVAKLLPHERPKDDQKEMRCLSRDEISRVLEAASPHRWKTLFALLSFTGLRISEALALTWDDVLEDRVIVRQGKTDSAKREVILIPAVRSLLAALRLQQAPGVQFVFATSEGGSCGRREALRALRAAEKRAGVPEYTLHELRHTFASILIAQGELPTLVARQMGHKDPSITLKTYTHLWEEQESVDRARDRLQMAMGGVL